MFKIQLLETLCQKLEDSVYILLLFWASSRAPPIVHRGGSSWHFRIFNLTWWWQKTETGDITVVSSIFLIQSMDYTSCITKEEKELKMFTFQHKHQNSVQQFVKCVFVHCRCGRVRALWSWPGWCWVRPTPLTPSPAASVVICASTSAGERPRHDSVS